LGVQGVVACCKASPLLLPTTPPCLRQRGVGGGHIDGARGGSGGGGRRRRTAAVAGVQCLPQALAPSSDPDCTRSTEPQQGLAHSSRAAHHKWGRRVGRWGHECSHRAPRCNVRAPAMQASLDQSRETRESACYRSGRVAETHKDESLSHSRSFPQSHLAPRPRPHAATRLLQSGAARAPQRLRAAGMGSAAEMRGSQPRGSLSRRAPAAPGGQAGNSHSHSGRHHRHRRKRHRHRPPLPPSHASAASGPAKMNCLRMTTPAPSA
jgi:hypothetical protein